MEAKTTVKFIKLNENALPPVYATAGAAAADLYALVDSPITVKPGERALVPTGIAIALPSPDTVALICARSGLASKKGITMANGIGVVDSDYRGEVKVPIVNLSSEPFEVKSGERIAQIMIMPVLQASFVEADSLDATERGAGGFGSTGTAKI